jgi:predicted RNase H-like HicB family nuclease
MTFTVLVHEAEEGGYWAEVPELPGCASQGDTLDELRLNIQEAIEACLAAYREDEGQPPRRLMTWNERLDEDSIVPA